MPTPSRSSPQVYEIGAEWMSTTTRVLSLESSLNIERVSAPIYAHRVRSLNSLPALPFISPPDPPFVIVVALERGADTFYLNTVNALLRLLPYTGLALLDLCKERSLISAEKVSSYVRAQRDRAAVGATKSIDYFVDLSSAEPTRASLVKECLRVFLNFNDEEICRRARSTQFAGVIVPDI